MVGDAAGNDVLFVDSKGRHIKVLAVLPPQPHKITAADAKAIGAGTDCVIGITYNFEPVPTDVEVGRHGALYLSTLPAVPRRQASPRVAACGGSRATTCAGSPPASTARPTSRITPSGRILVAELFSGRISTIAHGKPAPVIDLPGVASVEFYRHAVYAGRRRRRTTKGPDRQRQGRQDLRSVVTLADPA